MTQRRLSCDNTYKTRTIHVLEKPEVLRELSTKCLVHFAFEKLNRGQRATLNNHEQITNLELSALISNVAQAVTITRSDID